MGIAEPAMPRDDRPRTLARSLKSLNDGVKQAGPAAAASYTLIGAILFLGGIGYAIDAYRGGGHMFLVGGLVLGMVVGFYGLAMSIWRPK
jgi:F0F1-type ATP synthase assembly protein I